MSNETPVQAAAPASETGATTTTEQTNVVANNDAQINVSENNVDSSEGQLAEQGNQQEPTNLEEALKQVYEMEPDSTERTVQGEQTDGGSEHIQEGHSVETSTEPSEVRQHTDEQQDDTTTRESTDRSNGFNERVYRDRVSNAALDTARKEAVAELQNNGVKLLTLSDLTQRDEESGRVILINPDTGEPTDRVSAQKWIEVQNAQVKAEANRLANQKASAYMDSLKPAMETQVFLNTRYNTMDKVTQDVFNELIEPYAVNNKAGQRVGFNCDLNSMADRASAIVSKFNPAQTIQQSGMFNTEQTKSNQVETPAIDTPAGSNDDANKPEYPEPKSLEDALKIVYAKSEGE